MLRKYIVTIDGTKFEVEVEENGVVKSEKSVQAEAAPIRADEVKAPAAPPAAETKPAAAPAKAAAPVGGNALKAPLPGTLVKVLAKSGASVKEGDKLCVIEAMKMENPIVSPWSGTVLSVVAQEGDMLNAGDTILFVG